MLIGMEVVLVVEMECGLSVMVGEMIFYLVFLEGC